MKTRDLKEDNIRKIAELFPSCITETTEDGKTRVAVDFEVLKRQLSGLTIPEEKERYIFTWPGKSESQRIANEPTSNTLRPCREESVDFDNTKNIYIEGDNLEALKIMRETYLGKVDVIYIDPPYNTGKDFVYKDNFSMSSTEYITKDGEHDEYGNSLIVNTSSSGRLHTNWLNMMYPRIILAKDFLSETGTLFISIDEREYPNLRKICDEVLGENNYVGDLVWEATTQPTNAGQAKYGLQKKTESILVYRRNKTKDATFKLEQSDRQFNYPHNGKFGKCRFEIIEKSDAGDYNRESMKFEILGQYPRPGKRWQIGIETAHELEKQGKLEIVDGMVKRAIYPEDELDKIKEKPFWSLLTASQVGTAQDGKDELNTIMECSMGFDTVKPIKLMKTLIEHINNPKIVMDFFSGSSTMACAIMEYNIETNQNIQYIMVQIPHPFEEKTDAYKAGYKNICEMAKERIRRTGNKLTSQQKIGEIKPDVGFRTFKVDSSNMNDVFYDPDSMKKDILDYAAENIKSDRSGQDLLIQAMLELGIELSADIREETISGKTVFTVDSDYLVACFDSDVNDNLVTEIAKRQPRYVVLRDSSMASDAVAINFGEIFKTFSPNTKTKVL